MKEYYLDDYGGVKSLILKLRKDEVIDTVSVEMVSKNRIKGILPLYISQLNGDNLIKYHLVNKISIEQIFQQTISDKFFKTILRNITTSLISLYDYMLYQNSILLNMDIIFIDRESGEVGLIYKPVINDQKKSQNFNRFLKEVILEAKIENSGESDFLNTMYRFLNENRNLTVQSFKDFLNSSDLYVDEHIEEVKMDDQFISSIENSENIDKLYESCDLSSHMVNSIPTRLEVATHKNKSKFSFLSLFKNKKNKVNEMTSFQSVLNQSIESPIKSLDELDYYTPITSSTLSKKDLQATTVLSIPGSTETTILNRKLTPILLSKKNGDRFFLSEKIHTIGSDKNVSNIVITNNDTVSRKHAFIMNEDGKLTIEDCQSTNGTFINGIRLKTGISMTINHSDTITFADEIFEIRMG